MHCHNNGDISPGRFRQDAGMNQRIKIVNMNNIRMFFIQKTGKSMLAEWVVKPAEKCFYCTAASAEFFRTSSKKRYFMPSFLQKSAMGINHGFFSGIFSVVVMYNCNFQRIYLSDYESCKKVSKRLVVSVAHVCCAHSFCASASCV